MWPTSLNVGHKHTVLLLFIAGHLAKAAMLPSIHLSSVVFNRWIECESIHLFNAVSLLACLITQKHMKNKQNAFAIHLIFKCLCLCTA